MTVIKLIKKNGGKYLFRYDNESVAQLMESLGRFASDPELDFTWYDAAVLSKKVRDLAMEKSKPTHRK